MVLYIIIIVSAVIDCVLACHHGNVYIHYSILYVRLNNLLHNAAEQEFLSIFSRKKKRRKNEKLQKNKNKKTPYDF